MLISLRSSATGAAGAADAAALPGATRGAAKTWRPRPHESRHGPTLRGFHMSNVSARMSLWLHYRNRR
jgi:hypothetical protein